MQQSNPFQPPAAEVADIARAGVHEPASRGRRFGTLVVDYCGYLSLSFLIGLLVAAAVGPSSVGYFSGVPGFVYGLLVLFVYYGFFEGIWARTPGKWIFGTVVTNETGGKPSFGQVLGRTACRFIPFEAFSFFGENGWHDKIPKTRVVRASRGTT